MPQKKNEDRPVLRNNREQTVPLTDHINEIWTSAQDTKIMIYNVLLKDIRESENCCNYCLETIQSVFLVIWFWLDAWLLDLIK